MNHRVKLSDDELDILIVSLEYLSEHLYNMGKTASNTGWESMSHACYYNSLKADGLLDRLEKYCKGV